MWLSIFLFGESCTQLEGPGIDLYDIAKRTVLEALAKIAIRLNQRVLIFIRTD